MKNHFKFLRGPGAFGKSGIDVAVAPHATIVGIRRVRAGNTCPTEQPAASRGGGADARAERETPAAIVVALPRKRLLVLNAAPSFEWFLKRDTLKTTTDASDFKIHGAAFLFLDSNLG